ncbi:MAG TPA: PaaI family thioesterase [Acidimicrobiia bacterium]|nr:PaaI family thioesterase [Acidimicrobiia bacterium]
MTPDPGIVDGHGPDATHPPGPALRRLVDALRVVTDQVVRTAAAPDVLTRAAEAVEQAAAILEPVTPAWRPAVPALPFAELEPHEYFPFSPMIGLFNPLAPPIHLEVDGLDVRGEGTLGSAYEGPPGCVHGGVIAALFDELLGVANITSGVGAMTGTLTVKYRSPTPLNTRLTFAARTDSIEGRKVFTSGTIHAGERLCAEAEGVFIQVPQDRFVQHALEHGGTEAAAGGAEAGGAAP